MQERQRPLHHTAECLKGPLVGVLGGQRRVAEGREGLADLAQDAPQGGVEDGLHLDQDPGTERHKCKAWRTILDGSDNVTPARSPVYARGSLNMQML